MKKKNRRLHESIRVPVSWRILSLLSMLPLGMAVFYGIFRKSGGRFPLRAGDSTDPYFFGFIFAVLLPATVYIFIVDKILKGIVMKRSGKTIAKDIAEDVAKTAAVMAAEVASHWGRQVSIGMTSRNGSKNAQGRQEDLFDRSPQPDVVIKIARQLLVELFRCPGL